MKLSPERISAFLHVLSETCNVGKAANAIGIARRTAYEWREQFPEFATEWDKALKIGVSALEDEAHRRAFEGTDKPLVHQGQFTYARDYDAINPNTGERYAPAFAPVKKDENGNPIISTVKEYSDTLAIFLLKAHDPEKYRERQDINFKGQIDIADSILAARKRVGGGN